ncbi:hypothetical protein J2Y73_003998 [Peribacillus frigoritolerans]|nr:hypothetical protein [Peribacillus frigoritolerans]
MGGIKNLSLMGMGFYLRGARFLRVQGETPQARSVEGKPPAESECLEWKSTVRVLQTLKKIVDKKEVYLTVKTKLIGTEGARLLREMRVQGRPRRCEASRRLTDRPRKASAWSGYQRFEFYKPKNCSQTRFSSSSSAVCNRFNVRLNRHS